MALALEYQGHQWRPLALGSEKSMKRISGNSLLSLDCGEWKRVHATLEKRFDNFDKGNILSIGFGNKVTAGQVSKIGLAVIFHVNRKRNPRSKKRNIPSEVTIRLKQKSGRYALVTMPTDVQQVYHPKRGQIDHDLKLPLGLNLAEWKRLHKTLHSRFKKTHGKTIRAVGLGPKRVKGQVRSYGVSVRLHVKKKCSQRRKKKHIPCFVSVRVRRRNKSFTTILLPTDVEQVSPCIPTSSLMSVGNDIAGSTGVPVSVNRSAGTIWGVQTVSHPFQRALRNSQDISVLIQGRGSGASVSTKLKYATTLPASNFDVAFLGSTKSDLVQANFISATPVTQAIVPEATLYHLANQGGGGFLLPPSPSPAKSLTFRDYSLEFIFSNARLKKIYNVIKYSGSRDTFVVHTSGSPVLTPSNSLAGMQIATDNNGRFDIGYAQAAFAIADLLDANLGPVNVYEAF